jgi:membrane-bound lytic murein transglycosylase D
MMISKIMYQTRIFVSNRSNRNTMLSVAVLSFFMGFLNATQLPEATEKVEKIQKMILEGLVVTKDATEPENREKILDDYDNRIAEDFTIPAGLRQRVGFWFDIY